MPRRASSNKLRSMETLEARNLLAADCGPGDDIVAMVSPSVESSAVFADEVVASPQRVSAARIGFGSLFGSSRDNSIGNANNLGTLDRDRSVSGSIGGFDSLDFFRFDVSNQVQLDLTLANRAFGTRLSLFDQSGNLLKNDTGNSNLQIHTTLNRGVYYVGVGNWSFFSSRYELDLEVSRPQPTVRDAVGDTLRSAYDLGAVTGTRRVQEAVGAGDRADVFRFDIDRTSSVNLSLSKLAADADLSLLDSRGNVLSKSDRAGNAAESIRGRLPSGSYFVSITPYRNASSCYEFSITATPQVPTTPPASPCRRPSLCPCRPRPRQNTRFPRRWPWSRSCSFPGTSPGSRNPAGVRSLGQPASFRGT